MLVEAAVGLTSFFYYVILASISETLELATRVKINKLCVIFRAVNLLKIWLSLVKRQSASTRLH